MHKIQNKLSHFDKLSSVSLAFLGVSSPRSPGELGSITPNLKALDLTGKLLSEWKDVGVIFHELQELATLNLSCNVMSHDVTGLPVLHNIRVLVLSFSGIKWAQDNLVEHNDTYGCDSDDSRLSSSSVFIGGFILGGLVVGTLGCVYAPQISKAIAGTDRKDLMRKLPKFIYDEEKALEKTRQILTEKIAQLNSAIDDVSSQLRTDNVPNGAAINSDEMEATI